MRGSRNFHQGGPGQSHKKALTTFFFFFFFFCFLRFFFFVFCFFSPELIFTEVKWLISKKTIIFQGFRGGPTFSRGGGGGVQLFPGGSTCLFPIETHITCDFPEGVRTPCPPPPSGSTFVNAVYLKWNLSGDYIYNI